MGNIVIRPGRSEDEPDIQEFTRNTFEWGDYVADAFPEWVKGTAQGEGDVHVAVAIPEGKVVGVNHVRYLSPEEAWFEGIRVHPDYRRAGIGRLLTAASIEGARGRGVKMCRAAIDADNLKSQGLARSFGFRPVVPIIQFEMDLAAFLGDFGSADCARPDRLTVRPAGAEDAPAVYRAAYAEMSYIGGDYTWWKVTPRNVERVIASGGFILAVDTQGNVVAGAALSDTFVDDGSDKPVLYGEVSSVFGDWIGVLAVLSEYAAAAAKEAAERGLPGKLTVTCEAESAAARVLRQQGFVERFVQGRRDEIWLWELELN